MNKSQLRKSDSDSEAEAEAEAENGVRALPIPHMQKVSNYSYSIKKCGFSLFLKTAHDFALPYVGSSLNSSFLNMNLNLNFKWPFCQK